MPKITALPTLTTLATDDMLAIVDSSATTTKKVAISKLRDMLTPVGIIDDYAGATAPTGWLLCHGQILNASSNPEYQELYDAIGNTYGGIDNTDFVVPDLRGRVIAGQDDMGGTSANRLTGTSGGVDGDVMGGTGGAQTHTLTVGELASHSHGQVVTHTGSGGVRRDYDSDGGASAYPQGVNTDSAGGGGAHNNVQPTIILNKIIKY